MSGRDKKSSADIGSAEWRLRMLLANPPKRRAGLLNPESAFLPALLFLGLCLYWNFIIFPGFHEGQTFTGWLFDWAAEVLL